MVSSMGAGLNTLFMNYTVNDANIITQVCDNVKIISKISDWRCSNGTKLYNCFFSFNFNGLLRYVRKPAFITD